MVLDRSVSVRNKSMLMSTSYSPAQKSIPVENSRRGIIGKEIANRRKTPLTTRAVRLFNKQPFLSYGAWFRSIPCPAIIHCRNIIHRGIIILYRKVASNTFCRAVSFSKQMITMSQAPDAKNE